MEYKDYYAVLGVRRTASAAEIKKAFRKLARQHHPDAKPGDAAAENRFKDINEANEVLSDAAKRKRYDTLGANWDAYGADASGPGRTSTSGPFGAAGTGGNVRYEFRTNADGGDFSDFFRTFFSADGDAAGTTGGPGASRGSARATRAPGRGTRAEGGASFEDILAGMGIDGSAVGRGSGASAPAQPAAAEATAEISLEEAFLGTSRLVDVDGKRLEITIPKGADTGTRLRLSGRGPGGGDLFVSVRVRPDTRFTRRGADLERDLPLTLDEALLGSEVPVATLKGRVVLTIPASTQNGRTFRLTGQGMPRFRSDGNGDLYVRARVVLPTTLSDEARAAGRSFLDLVDQPDPR